MTPRRRLGLRVLVGLLVTVLVPVVLEALLRVVMGGLELAYLVRLSPDRVLCYEPIPNATVTYTGWSWRVAPSVAGFNREGYRGTVVTESPPPGVFRVAALGDSYTFGDGVNAEDTFSAALDRDFRRDARARVEVVNLGVFGYNSTQEERFYEHAGRKLHPALVVLFYVDNDLDPSDCDRNHLLDPARTRRLVQWRLYRLWMMGQLSQGHDASGDPYRETTGLAHSIAAFERLSDEAGRDGARVAVVMLSSHRAQRARLQATFDRLHFPWIDLEPELGGERSPNFIQGERHFTPRGNEFVARRVHDWLRAQHLVPDVSAP